MKVAGFVVPALADIGALRALADGVQTQRTCQPLQRVVILAHRRACLQPLRLGGRRAANGLNLDEFHHVSIVAVGGIRQTAELILRSAQNHFKQ